MRFLQIFKVGSILAMLAGVTACASITQVDNRGYMQVKAVDERIVVGQSTRQDVQEWLGSPSTISSFPPETWYYISRKKETIAFMEPELTDQQVVRIEFDAGGHVAKIEQFARDAAKDVDYVERETPTEGRTMGAMEQLLGNLGKFNTKRDASAAIQRR